MINIECFLKSIELARLQFQLPGTRTRTRTSEFFWETKFTKCRTFLHSRLERAEKGKESTGTSTINTCSKCEIQVFTIFL